MKKKLKNKHTYLARTLLFKKIKVDKIQEKMVINFGIVSNFATLKEACLQRLQSIDYFAALSFRICLHTKRKNTYVP